MTEELTANLPQLPAMDELWLETLSWQPSAFQQGQFQKLYELVLAGNERLNLTRISQPDEFWEKHLWDSLRGVFPSYKPEENSDFKVIDIGTGAGFPGLPVAIGQPNWQIKLLDSTRKKLIFIDSVLKELGIENGETITARAEELNRHFDHRQAYNLVLIRAVGAASLAAEYSLPLLKMNGTAILYRGHWTEEETQSLEPVLKKWGGEVVFIDSFTTPLSNSIRNCIHIKKTSKPKQNLPRKLNP
ncbi:16S rRNA (guanine(527)-N(7))-methyltransferase RsmG [Ancylothrix sp. C2]|uniref:16S rRNA (guanine(527)-N(7))-methyltransferase RsmG n=1 Tax=Ancylothrix sp. D3o TaxID=2953691 RepID=UPI0021BB46A6|nr:16S rRNA (guanine(527)-N(7))-methyltransferase RsmG [Ancylothrix sp. D3o]MCT7951385.1 16S rRNA (guanine(527)-N(7))-methyltransferase RsmG [Ancylothrix sp. D3o]